MIVVCTLLLGIPMSGAAASPSARHSGPDAPTDDTPSGKASAGTTAGSSPPVGPLGNGTGEILIGPPSTYFGEFGELVEHRVTVTNNVTHPVVADLSWNAPPPEWSLDAFDVDGGRLLDTNLNGFPDVSLGQVRSGAESVVVVMAVQVPTVAPPQFEITTRLTAQVAGAPDSAAVNLVTGIGPWVTLDRWADPTVINITNSGGVEETTITLSVKGDGPIVRQPQPIDVVFEVDRSGSMSWNDPTNLRVDAVQLYIDRMTDADRGSVIGFEAFAWVVNNRPLTVTDSVGRTLLKADVETLRGASGGTNLDGALELGTDWLLTYGDPGKKRIEILLTDGIGTTGNTDVILDRAVAAGIVIYTVGLGSQIDEAYLKHVADRTGGEYFHADSASQLAELYNELANRLMDKAARDPDPTDFDPMVVDVLPPHIHYVFGSAVDPSTNAPSPPILDGVDGDGNRVLGWNVASLAVNETWRVAFRVASSLGGLVPTNVNGLSRVSFDDFKSRSRTLFFPEVFVRVLAPPPETSITVGAPRLVGAVTYVTSATPFSFFAQDRSAAGIRRTVFRLDGSDWIDLTGGGTFNLWTEGEHLVEWFSEDNIGNLEAAHAAAFRVDNSPPQTELVLGPPMVVSGLVHVTSASPLSLHAEDGGVTPVGVETIEYRVDGGAWGNYFESFYLLTEGIHTVEYRSRDLLGNAEPAHTVNVYVDLTGPIFYVATGTPAYTAADTWVTSHTEIRLGASDRGTPPVGLDTFEYRVRFDAWSEWTPYEGPFMLSPEGRHVIDMRGRDRLGNEGSASVVFYVDDTPPVLTRALGDPKVVDGSTFISSETPLALTATEAGPIPVGLGSFAYRIDGGLWTAYTDDLRMVGEGPHVVDYRATDLLGNLASGSVNLVVDDTPPSLSLSIGTPKHLGSAIWVTSLTELAFVAVDGGPIPVGLEAVEYREWFGGWTPWTPRAEVLRLSGEGLHDLEVRASDRLGHTAATETEVIVDDSPPEAVLSVGEPVLEAQARFLTSATPLSLRAEDRGVLPVGLRDTEYRFGGVWRQNAESFVVTGADGPYRVEFRATDLLGHATEGGIDVVLDNTPPETHLTMSYDPKTKEALLTLGGTDAGSGVATTDILLNEGSWGDQGQPIPLGVGRHVVRFHSMDRLGNVEMEKMYAIVIPGEGPRVSWNWTPSVAFTFAIVLIVAGAAFARRERLRGAMLPDAAREGAMAIPFVAAELGIGLLSLRVDQLQMPPVFGWGLLVLVAVLVSGVAFGWLSARSVHLRERIDSVSPSSRPSAP